MKGMFYVKCLDKSFGKTKNGKDWYLGKFIDDDESHLNLFVPKKDYDSLKKDSTYTIYLNLSYNLKTKLYEVKYLGYEVI